jgi:superfamily I DNA/RNA helicase
MKLAGKWKVVRLDALAAKLEAFRETEVARLMAKGKENSAASLNDKIETLIVLIDGLPAGSKVEDLRRRIDSMFSDTNGEASKNLTLSTVHKAKGREYPTVYLLGRERFQPSPYARQLWQMKQEENLCYVAVTRAKERLIEVPAPPKEAK